MATIAKSLERLTARGKLPPEARDATLARIRPTTEMKDLAPCDLLVEAVLENYDLKAEIIGELDAICGEPAIFATNTSSISVTQIAAASRHPERVVGMHFFAMAVHKTAAGCRVSLKSGSVNCVCRRRVNQRRSSSPLD
jgi:3-hydroxybutyryl-CoA dehydrogenase